MADPIVVVLVGVVAAVVADAVAVGNNLSGMVQLNYLE